MEKWQNFKKKVVFMREYLMILNWLMEMVNSNVIIILILENLKIKKNMEMAVLNIKIEVIWYLNFNMIKMKLKMVMFLLNSKKIY